MKRNVFILLAVFFLMFGLAGYAYSQPVEKELKYPTRPIQVIIPYAAGGGTDINARLVASYWKKSLGQPIVIVNRPGAAGALGYREISHAKPDGYTLGVLSYPDSPVLLAAKGETIGFRNEDFSVFGTFTRTPDVLAVKQGAPFITIQEFVEYAKKNPGKITVSVPGDAHKLALILIEQAYGIDLNPVMFKSGGEAMNTLLGGHVQATVCASQFAIPLLDKGIVPLALTGGKRLAKLPNTRSFKELGHDIPIEMMRIFCAPQDVSPSIQKKLAVTLMELTKDAEFIEKVNASREVYSPLFGPELEKYYKATNAKITNTVARFKNRFAE